MSSRLHWRMPFRVIALCGLGVCLWQVSGAVSISTRADATNQTISQPVLETVPIREIRPGMRVLAENPELDEVPGAAIIDPDEWRLVHYRMTKPDGSLLDIDQLEQVVLAETFAVGDTVPLRYEELGISGEGTIVSINRCPKISDGAGRVVTASFRHSVADVLDIHTQASDEPIGTTANHPFWSVDRRDWVQAGNLVIGEHLLLADGRLDEVVTLLPRPGPHAVYNLTVEGTHTYHVGTNGVLVHNSQIYDLNSHLLAATDGHHAVPTYVLDGLDQAGVRGAAHVSQNVVNLTGNAHTQLHHVIDNANDASRSVGRSVLTSNGRIGGADNIANLINNGTYTPTAVIDELIRITKVGLHDYPAELLDTLAEIRRVRGLLGI
jgi:hypothetical protein